MKKLPVSGSEPKNITFYEKEKPTRRNNCYAFAFGHKGRLDGVKQQPGNQSGLKGIDFPLKSCKDLMQRVERDYKNKMYVGKVGVPCKRGYAKVMPFIAPERDFHFYRQEPDGTWAHKRGLTPVTKVDACGKPILNPRNSCRDFGNGLDYTTACPVVCRKVSSTTNNKKSNNKKSNNNKKNAGKTTKATVTKKGASRKKN